MEIYESTAKNGYCTLSAAERAEMNAYCGRYTEFLKTSKTERTTVKNAVALLEAKGFRAYEKGSPVKPGDKVYFNIRKNALLAAVIGEKPLDEGMGIVASHVDSPRLDVRPVPVYEDTEMAFLGTHYYGWVRRYQWVSLPLMLTGVVFLSDGSSVEVCIGADKDDPVLVIPDLLPHLGAEQNQLPLKEAHKAEAMNVILASEPLPDTDESKAVKLHALKLLYEKYGIKEDDFMSAELELVPALCPRDAGLDRSLIGAYGHDDRVCGYAALDALVNLGVTPSQTAAVLWADKEEIGNTGITGSLSHTFDYCIGLLCKAQGVCREECYEHSFCLSADVTSAYDPNFADAFNKQNAAKVNRGIAVCKYTGSEGKERASDAKAELLGYMRVLFKKHGVLWQTSEMGRTDLGGGGTVALTFANRGIDTLDAGVAVLGMHSPFELVSKLDCYMTNKASRAVFLG